MNLPKLKTTAPEDHFLRKPDQWRDGEEGRTPAISTQGDTVFLQDTTMREDWRENMIMKEDLIRRDLTRRDLIRRECKDMITRESMIRKEDRIMREDKGTITREKYAKISLQSIQARRKYISLN